VQHHPFRNPQRDSANRDQRLSSTQLQNEHKREIRFADFGQFFAQFALASIQPAHLVQFAVSRGVSERIRQTCDPKRISMRSINSDRSI
jgi:hypothetical protein